MEAADSKRASGWKRDGKFEGCNEKRTVRRAARRAAKVDKAVTDLQTLLAEAKESEKSLKRDLQQLESEIEKTSPAVGENGEPHMGT